MALENSGGLDGRN